jgi:pyruvate/2-oxoglutarate dehydrogenase complex dihydrolipoamide dehydrogenase (E3) component
MRYDIAVIGNDEAAFEVSWAARKAGLRTLAVLPEQRHSSWMVGQALMRLTGELLQDRSFSRQRNLRRSGSPRLLQRLVAGALTRETREHMLLLDRAGADFVSGEVRLQSRSRLAISSGAELKRFAVETINLVIATGVRRSGLHRPLGLVPWLRPETVLNGWRLPEMIAFLGGDVVGAGLAALFGLFGSSSSLLTVEDENSAALELAHAAGVRIVAHPSHLGLSSEGSPREFSGTVVDCRRVTGFTDHLGLPSVGIEPDEHGQLWCAANLETWCEGVFGAGDVIGFSSTVTKHPTDQAERILNRIQHRIPRPHFLRTFQIPGNSGTSQATRARSR